MLEPIYWALEKYDTLGAWIIILIFTVVGALAAAALRILAYLTPFTIITIVAVATVIPGIILAVKYLDYLKGN
jgi:uncharacterized membrane protein YjjP (DUF1212 family)